MRSVQRCYNSCIDPTTQGLAVLGQAAKSERKIKFARRMIDASDDTIRDNENNVENGATAEVEHAVASYPSWRTIPNGPAAIAVSPGFV